MKHKKVRGGGLEYLYSNLLFPCNERKKHSDYLQVSEPEHWLFQSLYSYQNGKKVHCNRDFNTDQLLISTFVLFLNHSITYLNALVILLVTSGGYDSGLRMEEVIFFLFVITSFWLLSLINFRLDDMPVMCLLCVLKYKNVFINILLASWWK